MHPDRHRRTGILVTAFVVCGASGAVLLGSALDAPALARLGLDLAPMQPETALALLVIGITFLLPRSAPVGARTATIMGLGVLAFALGSAALALGIGAAVGPAAAAESLRATHLAPGAALGLALVAGAGLAARRLPATAAILGGVAAALGAGALLGLVSSLPDTAPARTSWTHLAPGTAVCLVLLGGQFAQWPFRASEARERRFRAGALVAGLMAATLTVLFWQALVEREDAHFRDLVRAGTRGIRGEVESRLSMRGRALSILAREWEGRFFRTRGRWESDVRLVLSQSPGLLAVEWIEANGRVDWVYPTDVQLPPPDPKAFAAGASKTSPAILAGPLISLSGVPAFRILAPLLDSGEVVGWLAGTYAARDLFGEILTNVDSSFAVAVVSDDSVLFRNEEESSDAQQRWAEWRELRLPGTLELVLRVEPSDGMIAAARSPLPTLLLAGGLALSALLGLALFLRDLSASRARELAREARAHQEAAEEIRRLNLELEERVRVRTAELDRSNQELKQFASFLSHELRQPLSAQAVWADVLARNHWDSLDEEGRRCVTALREGVGRAAELLESQLALAAVHRAAFETRPVDMTSLTRDVVSDLETDLAAAEARVEIGALPVVRGDPQQLRQLIRNLVQNAIKYRCPTRRLEIDITGGDRGEAALIRVRDNGRGFEASEGRRIFEPGVRLAPELAAGDGMGLSLCERIAARHSGSICAHGRPGEGTEITVSLPRAETPAPGAKTHPQTPATRG